MDANKQLTTRGNGRFVTNASAPMQKQPDEMDVILEQLPRWLAYLVGAFPAAKTNKMTYFAYEDSFVDEDQEMMFQAVRTAVRKHKFQTFPTIAEIDNLLKHVPYDITEAERTEWDKALAAAKITGDYTAVDAEIIRWEQQRGEMRPLAEIEAEISEARQQLREMLQGVNIYAMSGEAVTQ